MASKTSMLTTQNDAFIFRVSKQDQFLSGFKIAVRTRLFKFEILKAFKILYIKSFLSFKF